MNLLNVYTRLVNKATTLISNDEVVVARAVTLSALTHTVEAEKEMTPALKCHYEDQVDLIMGREVSSKEVEVAVEIAIEEADVEELVDEVPVEKRIIDLLDAYTNKVTMLNSMSAKKRNTYTRNNCKELAEFFHNTRVTVDKLLTALAIDNRNDVVLNFLNTNKEKDHVKYLSQVVQMIASL